MESQAADVLMQVHGDEDSVKFRLPDGEIVGPYTAILGVIRSVKEWTQDEIPLEQLVARRHARVRCPTAPPTNAVVMIGDENWPIDQQGEGVTIGGAFTTLNLRKVLVASVGGMELPQA